MGATLPPDPPDAADLATELLPADERGIARAVELLAGGDLVVLPTETVYGLAADAANPEAVARVFAAKGRPRFNPLIIHVADVGMAARVAVLEGRAAELAARFWPGPLTLVLPLLAGAPVASLATAGLPTVAVRAPDHPAALATIAGLGRPVAAPSANRSGRISPTRAEHALAELRGRTPLILDGGPTRAGIESTIVAVAESGLRLLRPGAITAEALGIEQRESVPSGSAEAVTAPGQLPSHYAPEQPVRLDAVDAGRDEWLIGFGPVAGDESLSPSGDLTEAAARLFDALRRAEASGRARIAVAPVPDVGLGRAINDRLRRAAAPR